ncbi:MAG: ribosome silencing factor [bacterium]
MARPKKDSTEYYVSKIKKIIEGKKGYDVVTLDMKGFSFTDYFVIASGETERQLNAIADEIIIKLDEDGKTHHHREGKPDSKWILLDFGDIVIHLFEEKVRKYFNLERLWYEAVKE